MIKKSLEKALQEIDPEIIDEVANEICKKHLETEAAKAKTVKFKKRIILIAAAAALAIAAVTIPLIVMMNKASEPIDIQPGTPTNVDPTKPTDVLVDEPTKTPIVTPTPSDPTIPSDTNEPTKQSTDRRYYCLPSEEDEGVLFNAGFENVMNCGVDAGSERRVLTDVNVKVASPITGIDLPYQYSDCFYANPVEKTIGSFYSVYDIYRFEGETIEMLHGTDLIVFYKNNNAPSEAAEELTEENLFQIAQIFLNKIGCSDALQNLVYEGVSEDASGMYAMSYSKIMGSYKTDETLSLRINKAGAVVGFNGYNLGKYNAISESVDFEIINATANDLNSKIDALSLDNLTKGSMILVTDTNANLYVCVFFTFTTNDGISIGEQVYCKVE